MGTSNTMQTSLSIFNTADIKDMFPLFSIIGKHIGMRAAQIKLDINVYVVISSRLPPSLAVTTAAAAAHGPMMHVNTASANILLLPERWKIMMTATMTATNTTWNTPTQKCQGTGISFLKSTLQNVTKRMQNIKRGSISSPIGANLVAIGSSIGTNANIK